MVFMIVSAPDDCRIECRSKLALQKDGSADAKVDRKTVSIGWFRTAATPGDRCHQRCDLRDLGIAFPRDSHRFSVEIEHC